jgi:hypothetical protein
VIPLYGFLQGDSLGLLILADPDEPLSALALKLQTSARMRVAARPDLRVIASGRTLDPRTLVRDSGLTALDRFDVVAKT